MLPRLRGGAAAQIAVVAPDAAVSALYVDDRTRDGARDLECFAGTDDGRVLVLPYDLSPQWLQGAVWRPTAHAQATSAVCCLQLAWDVLFCGTATGAILAFTPGQHTPGVQNQWSHTFERLSLYLSSESLQVCPQVLRVHELILSWDPLGAHLSSRSRTMNVFFLTAM